MSTMHQLRIFETVARHFNFTKAAQELHISQPSVFQQVKRLEEEYGVKLYKKVGRGIGLTEDGRLFLRDAKPILIQFVKLRTKFSAKRNERDPERLAIGGSYSVSASFLPRFAAHFTKTHPRVQLNFRAGSSHAIEELVLSSEVEIAVVTYCSQSPHLIYEPCRQEKLVAFVSKMHPLAKKGELSLQELVRAPLIIRKGKAEDGSTWEILDQLQKRGFKLNIIMECELPEDVKFAVKAGMGLAILYRDIVEPDLRAGGLKVVKVPQLKMRVGSFIVYRRDRTLSAHASDFLTLLREWSRKNPR